MRGKYKIQGKYKSIEEIFYEWQITPRIVVSERKKAHADVQMHWDSAEALMYRIW